MRDYCNTYIYENNGKKIHNHEHIIFISDFQINKIIESPHLYFDGTFVYPKEFAQMIIVLYYDTLINKRALGAFILLNNKKENSYLIIFQSFKHIITLRKNYRIIYGMI